MKKLMFMLATVACAATMQAAVFDWSTSSKLYGVTAASVVDNGSYGAASSGSTDRGDKVLTSLSYVLTLFDASTDAEVGSASGTVSYGSLGKVDTSGINVAAAAQGTTYKYVLALTGAQSDLQSRGEVTSGEYKYDYSAATVATELSGTITTATMGNTDLGNIVPSAWTVSGITKTPVGGGGGGGGGVPEPTSGLLLALGGAMLALRRKR